MVLMKQEVLMDQEEVTPTTTFTNWLQEQLNLRNWTASDLAKRAEISEATLSRILSKGDRDPGPKLCRGIAKAFGMEADEVFRLAGLLPEGKEFGGLSEVQREVVRLTGQLDETSQRMVLEVVKGLVSRRSRKQPDPQ